jgi:outer membrane protein TolC
MKPLWTSVVCCLVLISGHPALADEYDGGPMSVQKIVAVALENNPAVKEAEANIGAAAASVKSSRAEMLPEAGFSYGYTSLMDPPIMKVGGANMQASHQRIYNWDVTVVQPLFTGHALSSKLDISKLDVEARLLEKSQVAQDLTLGVKSACYNLILAGKLLAVGEDEVKALKEHRRNAEMFFEQGLIRKNDLLQAQVALANSSQQLERARADVRKAEMALNRLMNRPLELPVIIDDTGLEVKRSGEFDIIDLGETALEKRPIMQLLDVGLDQLGLNEKIAKSAWYPSLALVGQYERSGDDPLGTNNDYSNEYNASITAQLQWKFWVGGKTGADVENAQMKMRSLRASIERYRSQVVEEVRGAVLDCEVSLGNIETAESALAQARENWRITDLQYRQQTALASDVLDARTFLSQADANYYRAVYGYLNAVASLEHAVGSALPL